MFRRIAVLSILASAVVSSTMRADLTFTAGASPVRIPVKLVESSISDTLLGYDFYIDFSLPADVAFVGAADVLGLGGFITTMALPADLGVNDVSAVNGIPSNLSSPTTTLFTIDFDVTTSGTGDISRAVFPTGDANSLVYQVPNPAYTGPMGPEPEFKSSDPVPFTIATTGDSIILTAVPEPSEWILGLLMTGLLGTIASKRFFAKKQVAETK